MRGCHGGRARTWSSRERTTGTCNGSRRLVLAAQAGDTMAVGDLLDLVTPYVRRLCGPIALDEGADATQRR